MKKIIFGFVLVPVSLFGQAIDCELRVRNFLNDPFETQKKTFTGEMPISITVKECELKVRNVLVQGKTKLSLFLGKSTEQNSAVGLYDPETPSIYLNFRAGDVFAVAECESKP